MDVKINALEWTTYVQLPPLSPNMGRTLQPEPKTLRDLEKTVVVDNPSIHWKYSHEENNVTARKYHAKHLERERTPWFVVAQMTK